MNKWALYSFIGITLSTMVGCQTTEEGLKKAGSKNLSNAELTKTFLVDRDVIWAKTDGYSGTANYKTDGTSTVSFGSGLDTGLWKIVDDTFCQKWETAYGGSEYCVRFYSEKTGTMRVINFDGSDRGTMKFQ